jgi:hypothetical protein
MAEDRKRRTGVSSKLTSSFSTGEDEVRALNGFPFTLALPQGRGNLFARIVSFI